MREQRPLPLSLPSTQLTSLDLGSNQIGDAGATAIAAILPSTQLTSLDLWYNQIGDVGATAIAAILPSTKLTSISLWNNQIGDDKKRLFTDLRNKNGEQIKVQR